LPDEFVYSGPDYPDKEEPDGFIWGVRFAEAYPGMEYLETGERAAYWSGLMGRKMHEITVETNACLLRLVFADVRYTFVGNETRSRSFKGYAVERYRKNFRWRRQLIATRSPTSACRGVASKRPLFVVAWLHR
jgi:hypothetical protein